MSLVQIFASVYQNYHNTTSLLPPTLPPQLDDVTVNAENLRSQIMGLGKKQKKFDSQLSEQQALAEKNAQVLDQAEARARQAETKALSLTRELEGYQDKLEEVDRLRKQLTVSIILPHHLHTLLHIDHVYGTHCILLEWLE